MASAQTFASVAPKHTSVSPRRTIVRSLPPPNRPLELKPHRTRGHPPRKAGPNHKYNPKSQVSGVTPMLTAASPLLRPWHTMSRPKRNSRLDSSASWDERARTPLIYFPLNHPLWRGDTLKGAIRWDGTGCGGGWNGSRPWVKGMGARGARGGSRHDAGWVSIKKVMSAPRQTTSPPTCRPSIA